jgi:hypothetical protein
MERESDTVNAESVFYKNTCWKASSRGDLENSMQDNRKTKAMKICSAEQLLETCISLNRAQRCTRFSERGTVIFWSVGLLCVKSFTVMLYPSYLPCLDFYDSRASLHHRQWVNLPVDSVPDYSWRREESEHLGGVSHDD